MSYKLRKVYDVNYCGMSDEIRNLVAEQHEIMCNGYYFEHDVMPKTFLNEADDGTETVVFCEEHTALDDWFLDNGAVVGESVLILYWW